MLWKMLRCKNLAKSLCECERNVRKGRGCEIRIIFVSKEEKWRPRRLHCSLEGLAL